MLKLQKEIYGRYDAAQTTSFNSRHWAAADSASPETANNAGVRRTLRSRARYEVHEGNSLAKGIVLTLANSVIGAGPRLKVRVPGNNQAGRTIERQFMQWARAISLGSKLRTAAIAKIVDGEAFIQQISNPLLTTPVQLDLALNEADLITTQFRTIPPGSVDGIEFDGFGNPTVYHRLREHPGGTEGLSQFDASFDRIPAEEMIHVFREDRPGQRRGIPEITTALPLFAMLRRYGLAVLSSAEAVANISAVLYTDSHAVDADQVDPLDAIDFERNMMMSLPAHWRMDQIKAEQPTTTFNDFQLAIAREIARCVGMPLNLAILDSRGANFASGKLDTLSYNRSVEIQRKTDWECCVMDRVFAWWLDEAMLIPGYLPEGIGQFADFDHSWMWTTNDVIDEAKRASAVRTNLESGVTTLPLEFAALGLDWEEELESQASALGVPLVELQENLRLRLFANGNVPQEVAEVGSEEGVTP